MMVRKPASFPLLPLRDTVELEAELISGTGLTFHWKVTDARSTYEPTTVETRGRTSIARHRFSASGTYNVSVSVSNALLSQSGVHLAAHLEQPLRVVEAIDGLAADVIGSPYVVLLQPCGNSSDSQNEGAPSVSTTPSSNRSTGRRRRTVESCLGKHKPVEIRPPEIMRSGHTDDSHAERPATHKHQLATLPPATTRKEGDSRSLQALHLESEDEVQGDLDTVVTSVPRLLLRDREPRRVNRRTAGQRDDIDQLRTTTRDASSVESPFDRVPPNPAREQQPESTPQRQQQLRECRTGGVQFGAQVAKGSDVVFDFHFGDGRSRRVEATGVASLGVGSMAQPAASAVVSHLYERGGRFSVSVTASNPLGSVTRLIDRTVYVGSPAEGLTLEPTSDYAVVVAGRVGSFRAALRRGEDVTVAWELRSAATPAGPVRARNRGMTFEHMFDSPGTYQLTAEASNPITEGLHLPRPKAEVKIIVQEMLREATLCVWPPGAAETCAPADLTLPSEKRLLLRAFVMPATETTLRFLWSLIPQQEHYVTDAAVVNLRPTRPGIYVIRVTCQNHVSSVTSPELTLRLVERVTSLQGIVVLGPVLVSRPTRLRAIHTTGSNLTFVWNFGDGSDPVAVTDGPEVSHTFTRVREYWVKVVAYNVFSRAELETNVFAMLQPCNKPELRIHRHTKVRFDEVVFVEAAVSTWCPISTKVRYSWTVLNAMGSHVVFERHGSGALSRKDLLLPAGTVPVGRYLLALKARMVPTFVYAVENATLTVVPSPVSFSIAGGSWRTIGPSAVVILETELYPPHLTDYRITWKCEDFNDGLADCFTHPFPSSLAKRSTRTMRFLTSSLNLNISTFLFTATLALGNATSRVAQQVLDASTRSPRYRLIELHCQSCGYGRQVRSHERVVLAASCVDCDTNEELDFEWSLWHLTDLKSHQHGGGHSYGESGNVQIDMHNNGTQRSPHRRAYDIQPSLHQVNSGSPIPPFPEFANGTHTTSVHFEAIPDHRVTHLGKRQRSKDQERHRRIDSRLGDSSGSAPVFRETFSHPEERIEVDSFERSFLHNGWLILKPGALVAKSSYAVHVRIRRKGSSDVRGEARERITVGERISGGWCVVEPRTGVTLETPFTANCSSWKGGRKPYTYVVSYSLSPGGPWKHLYHGSHSTFSFWLPPGRTTQSNNVYISMVVQDGDGFQSGLPQTSMVTVLNGNLSDMKNKTSHLLRKITRLFYDQQYHAAMNKLQVLVILLRSFKASASSLHTPQLDFLMNTWRFAVRILRNMEPFPVNVVQAFIQTWNVIVEPPFLGQEHDLIAASQLLRSFVQDVQACRQVTCFEAVVQELVTALGHLVKSAQTLNLHAWHMFYEHVHTIEDMIKNFISDNYIPQETLHFSSAWLELTVSVAFTDMKCPASSVVTTPHHNYGAILHDPAPQSNMDAPQKQPTVCFAYRFPFLAFGIPQLPLLNLQLPSMASTFALNPTVTIPDQGTHIANFSLQHVQHRKEFVLNPGTAHVHKLMNVQDLSQFHLYIRVEMGHFAEGLQVYLSDGAEQLVMSRGITVHRTSVVTDLYADKAVLKDCKDCQLTVMQMPERIGNWKLTYGSSRLTYQLEGFGQRCLQFHPEINEWDTHGCSVTGLTNAHCIECKCQGGRPVISVIRGTLEMQLIEMPAHEIIGKETNWLVILFLVATTTAYALALCWLCRGDDGPRKAEHVFSLKTARSTARHLYLITVRTGPFFNAGTSAAVSVILHGEAGDSEVIRFADSCPVLHRCSTVAFLVGTDIALGNLVSVEVWHDNSGEFPSWFLEDVTVVHWNTQGSWYFVFNEWFSVSSKDGRIEREAFTSRHSPHWLRTLQHSFVRVLSEHHLWHSTVTMNGCSRFSRGQRTLLCFSTVLLSSALSSLRIYFADVELIATGPSTIYIVESGLISLVAHFIHQICSAIFRNYDCVALLQNVWAKTRMLLFCIIDATCRWATRGRHTPSHSSSDYSLSSSDGLDALYDIYRMQADGNRGSVGGQFRLSQLNEEEISYSHSTDRSAQLRNGQLHQEDSVPAASIDGSDGRGAVGGQNLESRESEEESVFRSAASPLEEALANLVSFQRQYQKNNNYFGDTHLESTGRGSSPSLGDSELTCLDFDTDDDEDSDDSAGVAYKVPSLVKTGADWPTWLVGSFGWFLVAGLIVGSACTLLCCTQMFLAGANVLCFKMTAVALLWSVFVVYPIQACMVTAYIHAHWHIFEKPQSALFTLPCACNEVLQRLLRRVRIHSAAPLRPLWHSNHISKRRSHGVASSVPQESRCHRMDVHNGLDTVWLQQLNPGRLLHHLARYPSERKLVALRKRCLAMVATFKAMRYQPLPAIITIATACATSSPTSATVTTTTTTTTTINFYCKKAASNTETLSSYIMFIINFSSSHANVCEKHLRPAVNHAQSTDRGKVY
uniref:Receptor for egg jelly 7 n=1 Tax=Rhipicephalus zambeziensis TaxID=60191 RepID=A0A224YXP2_9ACAR